MFERLNVLVACKEPRQPDGLDQLGVLYRVQYDTSIPWGRAANNLLDYAAEMGGDALFIDDDVTLGSRSLDGVRAHYDRADLFGLSLHVLSTGERQVGARHTWDGQTIVDWVHAGPAYVAHVSTSAIYIKASAIASGLRFPEWHGIHWEDVAFCFDAWIRGLNVMAVPGYVGHDIQGGAGATKRHAPAFWERWHENRIAFQQWCAEQDLSAVPREAIVI